MPRGGLSGDEVVSSHAELATYTDEERDWLVAMDALNRRCRAQSPPRLPSCTDVLAEAHRLGYRRAEVAAPLPPPKGTWKRKKTMTYTGPRGKRLPE